MSTASSLPLTASRIIVVAGLVLSVAVAVLLFIVAATLAIAWPRVVAEAVAKGMQVKVQDLQPWASLVLLGAGVILALTARVMQQLLSILKSVSSGEPFVAENTRRLRSIGWLMIVLQGAGLITGWATRMLPGDEVDIQGFTVNFSGVLAALLAFVLAEVFEKARRMRDDLEGTV